jgi:hypothetical protein
LTDFIVGLFLLIRRRAEMQYTFYYVSIFVMLLTLLIHIQFITAPMIFVPIGFLLSIIFIAIGIILAMKTEVDLDFMFHKDPDDKD